MCTYNTYYVDTYMYIYIYINNNQLISFNGHKSTPKSPDSTNLGSRMVLAYLSLGRPPLSQQWLISSNEKKTMINEKHQLNMFNQ